LNYFQLPKLLAASDLAIDPKDSSTRQASGKILQYMGAGLPVICFDRTNNRQYLEDGGIYAKVISVDGIADAVLWSIENRQQLEVKGEINKQRIRNFSWDASALKIEHIYENEI
jgi:glycosyltransferase involved in cell wall biosynthesis